MAVKKIFPTLLYQAKLHSRTQERAHLHRALLREVEEMQELDGAGIAWSEDHYRNGYTSYASVNDLHLRSATFGALEKLIRPHVAKLARRLDYDLGGKPLTMSTCWVNVMPANTHHGIHLHPLSVISGTYYVEVPNGASTIKFEDPRLDRFMAAPPRKNPARSDNKTFVSVTPESGSVVLFESWLRHEVPMNPSKKPRISISFNYEWV